MSYKTKNKDECDYRVNIMAFPLTVRIKDQPFRDLKELITCCNHYLKHR